MDRRAVALSIAFVVAFAVLAALVAKEPLPIDLPILSAFGGLRDTFVWPVLAALNLVGYPAPWDTMVTAGAVLATIASRRLLPLLVPALMFVAEGTAVLAKLAVGRTRPNGILVQDLVTPASYPSGHTVRVVVTAWLFVLVAWPWLRARGLERAAVAGAVALSLLIGTARLASQEHWPSDVLGAYLLSGAFVAAVAAVLPFGSRS